jgi:hypothetical protein
MAGSGDLPGRDGDPAGAITCSEVAVTYFSFGRPTTGSGLT